MQSAVHNFFQIHLFVNYLSGFNVIAQKNRVVQIACMNGPVSIETRFLKVLLVMLFSFIILGWDLGWDEGGFLN